MATTLDYVKAQLPDYADTYVKDMLSRTQAYTDVNLNPYKQYTGERVAGFNPLQDKAFTSAANMAPSQYGTEGAGIASLAANQALGAGAGFTPSTFQGGQFGSPEAQQYMSPYAQNVVDIQQREAQRQADIATTQRNANAVGAGAFGGSRRAVMDAEAARNLAIQKGDIQAKGLQDAFTNAQTQFNTDQQRRLQAEQLGEQSKQYGAGLGLQGANTALQGASTLGNLGNQQYQQNLGIAGLQSTLGGLQQANTQAQNDINYQNFMAAQQYPQQMLSFQSNMLNGLPMAGSSGSVTTPESPNYGNTILGGILGIASKYAAKGGAIKDKGEPGLLALAASKYA